MSGHVVAMLLDNKLHSWGTREDLHALLSRTLIGRGARVLLVFSETPDNELCNRYRANGIEVTAISYGLGARHYYRQLGRVFREHSVTTVHIAFFSYFSLLPWMARLHGVRYIVYHERNPGLLRAKSWRKFLLRVRTRTLAWPMTRVIAISDFIRRQLIDVGMPSRKCHVVLHGVDVSRYRPDPSARGRLAAEYGIRPGETILASLSYLMPHKNIDVTLRACKRLKDEGLACRYFVIGNGPMKDGLQALGHELGLDEQVVWMGHIPDPVPVLQACDVFLMLSSGEGFGLALAEAMACGAASIAARSGALPEIVQDGKSGLIVPERDVAALEDGIRKLAGDDAFRRRLAANGLERVRDGFTAEASTARIAEIYESMWAERQ